jgi:hypothetical protein
MSLVNLYALEADYQLNKEAYTTLVDEINHGSPHPSDIKRAAQKNADLQTTLLQMSAHVPATESFKLLAATDQLEKDYTKLLGDSETIASMRHAQYIAWTLVAGVLLGIYFKN